MRQSVHGTTGPSLSPLSSSLPILVLISGVASIYKKNTNPMIAQYHSLKSEKGNLLLKLNKPVVKLLICLSISVIIILREALYCRFHYSFYQLLPNLTHCRFFTDCSFHPFKGLAGSFTGSSRLYKLLKLHQLYCILFSFVKNKEFTNLQVHARGSTVFRKALSKHQFHTKPNFSRQPPHNF